MAKGNGGAASLGGVFWFAGWLFTIFSRCRHQSSGSAGTRRGQFRLLPSEMARHFAPNPVFRDDFEGTAVSSDLICAAAANEAVAARSAACVFRDYGRPSRSCQPRIVCRKSQPAVSRRGTSCIFSGNHSFCSGPRPISLRSLLRRP